MACWRSALCAMATLMVLLEVLVGIGDILVERGRKLDSGTNPEGFNSENFGSGSLSLITAMDMFIMHYTWARAITPGWNANWTRRRYALTSLWNTRFEAALILNDKYIIFRTYPKYTSRNPTSTHWTKFRVRSCGARFRFDHNSRNSRTRFRSLPFDSGSWV